MTALEKAEKYRVQVSANAHESGFWTASAAIFLKALLPDDEVVIARMIHGGFQTKDEAEAAALAWVRSEIERLD